MDELECLAAKLNSLTVDPQARMGFDLFAGGLVWSDEHPLWDDPVDVDGVPTILGLGHFRALLKHRQSLILAEPHHRFVELWSQAQQLCPNWPGFLPERRDPGIAVEARARTEAALLSFDRFWEAFGNRQQAQANAPTA